MKAMALGLVCALAMSAATATEYRKLEGTYTFAAKVLVDPDPRERPDRLVVFLEGKAARDLYRRMPVAAVPDVCGSDLQSKTAGGIDCTFDPHSRSYQCSIGVMLKSGKAVSAFVC